MFVNKRCAFMDKLAVIIGTSLVSLMLTIGDAGAGPVVGERAPDFALRSLNGDNLRLSEYRPQVVVLGFWADWCGKCRQVADDLERISQRYQNGELQVLAVDTEAQPEAAAEFVSLTKVSFPVMPDSANHDASRIYDLKRVPLIVVIDKEGLVRHVNYGYDSSTRAGIVTQIVDLIAE